MQRQLLLTFCHNLAPIVPSALSPNISVDTTQDLFELKGKVWSSR